MMGKLIATALLLGWQVARASDPRFFVSMSDPQMGMFAENQNTVQEEANLTFVVSSINRLEPAFVVVCGDLVNRGGDREQIDQYKRIMRGVTPGISIYNPRQLVWRSTARTSVRITTRLTLGIFVGLC